MEEKSLVPTFSHAKFCRGIPHPIGPRQPPQAGSPTRSGPPARHWAPREAPLARHRTPREAPQDGGIGSSKYNIFQSGIGPPIGTRDLALGQPSGRGIWHWATRQAPPTTRPRASPIPLGVPKGRPEPSGPLMAPEIHPTHAGCMSPLGRRAPGIALGAPIGPPERPARHPPHPIGPS